LTKNEGKLVGITQIYILALIGNFCQVSAVRCPGHTIQFLNYGYTEYIRKTLKFLEINVNNLEMKKYENWTPYSSTNG